MEYRIMNQSLPWFDLEGTSLLLEPVSGLALLECRPLEVNLPFFAGPALVDRKRTCPNGMWTVSKILLTRVYMPEDLSSSWYCSNANLLWVGCVAIHPCKSS